MNYLKIDLADVCNGEGVRVVLWLTGCSHHCPGCHNPETWDASNGQPVDSVAIHEILEALSKDYIDGITITGGDPLYEENLQDVSDLISLIRILKPDKTIWLYTGYTYEECLKDGARGNIILMCDVIVDGKYEMENKSTTLPWRGSSNQKVVRIGKIFEDMKTTLINTRIRRQKLDEETRDNG